MTALSSEDRQAAIALIDEVRAYGVALSLDNGDIVIRFPDILPIEAQNRFSDRLLPIAGAVAHVLRNEEED